MGQPSCPLKIGDTINALDNFARVYTGNHPTHYPRGSTTTRSRGAEQLAPEYYNELEMIIQPVFWAYMQETQV